tara:strand:+ start:222 stop:446 length:225 start_codon:yes stop_codon:yes gene_type:complete
LNERKERDGVCERVEEIEEIHLNRVSGRELVSNVEGLAIVVRVGKRELRHHLEVLVLLLARYIGILYKIQKRYS